MCIVDNSLHKLGMCTIHPTYGWVQPTWVPPPSFLYVAIQQSGMLQSPYFAENVTLGEDEMLVSFDVSSSKLREDDSLAERTLLSLDRVAEL